MATPLLGQASIIIDQATLTPGVAGISRDDGVIGELVTLRNLDNSNITSRQWILQKPRASSAVLSSPKSASCSFTPDVDGTYVVLLLVNEGRASTQKQRRQIAVRSTAGYRYPAQGESNEANWPSAVTLTTNETGWWEDMDAILRANQSAIDGTMLTVDTEAALLNSRKLTAGAGITFVDGGAGGNFTLSVTAGFSGVKAVLDVVANAENLLAVRTVDPPTRNVLKHGQLVLAPDGEADGDFAAVLGGANGYASGDYALVVGGNSCIAGASAAVVGGVQNSAAGLGSFIGGGQQNEATGDNAVITGGTLNSATHEAAFIGAGTGNTASGKYAALLGGSGNTAGALATVGGGQSNSATGSYATVSGGSTNTTASTAATIAGGSTNSVTGTGGSIGGGQSNAAGGEGAHIGGGGSNTTSADKATIGGGQSNTASAVYATVAGGNTNTASGADATVGGGYSNIASATFATIAGGFDNTVSGDYSSVGGGYTNSTGASTNATIAGGYSNVVSGNYGTVSGGNGNQSNAVYAAVGGGQSNIADAAHACVAGGDGNQATAAHSAILGGATNTASGLYASVGGGLSNTASGAYSAIPGGRGSTASASDTVVIGRSATASHAGAVVIADGSGSGGASSAANQLVQSFTGGIQQLAVGSQIRRRCGSSASNFSEWWNGQATTANATLTTSNLFVLPTGQDVHIRGVLKGKKSTTSDSCARIFEGVFVNVGGVITAHTALTSSFSSAGGGNLYAATCAFSGTTFVVSFQGVAATTVYWTWAFDFNVGGAA